MLRVHVRCVHTLQNCVVGAAGTAGHVWHAQTMPVFDPMCKQRAWVAKSRLPPAQGRFSGCTHTIAHCTQPAGHRQELTCMAADQKTWCWLVPLVWNRHLREKMCFTPLSECIQETMGGRWLKHFHYLEVSSIRTLWFHKFTFFLTPSCPWQAPWKGMERGVHRKCTATKEGLKRFSLFLGFSRFFLPGDGARCQMRDKGGSIWCWAVGEKEKVPGKICSRYKE